VNLVNRSCLRPVLGTWLSESVCCTETETGSARGEGVYARACGSWRHQARPWRQVLQGDRPPPAIFRHRESSQLSAAVDTGKTAQCGGVARPQEHQFYSTVDALGILADVTWSYFAPGQAGHGYSRGQP
jgi:hypothetical protein